MNIANEFENIMLSNIKENAKKYNVSITDIKILLGLESLDKCIVLLKKNNEILGKLNLKNMLPWAYSLFYGKINEAITKSLIDLSYSNTITPAQTFVEIKFDNMEKISLSLFNGFASQVKSLTIEDIISSIN